MVPTSNRKMFLGWRIRLRNEFKLGSVPLELQSCFIRHVSQLRFMGTLEAALL